MLGVGGARKKNGSRKMVKRGGCGSWSSNLNPAPFPGLDNNLPTGANFAQPPNAFSTNQVGGDGYGFTSGGDASVFNAGYAPLSRYGGDVGTQSRGGNNYMAGGGRRRRTHRKKRSSHRHKKRGGARKKTYKQRGCSKKR